MPSCRLAGALLAITVSSVALGKEPPRKLDILEFQLEGATALSETEAENAIRGFLGPGRNLEDIESARLALEKAYSDKGYPSVSVSIPPQTVREGVVRLIVRGDA